MFILNKLEEEVSNDKNQFIIILSEEKIFAQLELDKLSKIFFVRTFNRNQLISEDNTELFSISLKSVNSVFRIDSLVSGNYLEKHFMLPLRNFKSTYLDNFVKIVENNTCYEITDENVYLLNKITRKPNSNKKSKSLIDEKKHFFDYGSFARERNHGRSETNEKDGHTIECRLSALFRFGIRFRSEEKHFDVSLEEKGKSKKITMTLINCHNETFENRTSEYFNIFPNDFIRDL